MDNEEQLKEWQKYRPEIIKIMAEKLKPWNRYRLKTTGQHCNIYSYSENGTVTIEVNGHDSVNFDAINRMIPVRVFGINPDDLEVLA